MRQKQALKQFFLFSLGGILILSLPRRLRLIAHTQGYQITDEMGGT